MYPNKKYKKQTYQRDSTSTSSMNNSGVKKLIDARNTIENNSFSGLDYDLMEGLFGRSCAPEIAQILYNSPPTALNSQFSQNQTEDFGEQSECVISENFQNSDSSTFSGVPQVISEASVNITSSCPSMSPVTSEFRVDCQTPGNRSDDDVTDCDSPNKQPMLCEASADASYTTEGTNNIVEDHLIDIQHTANDIIDISYPNSPSILPPLTSEFNVDRGNRSDDDLTDCDDIQEAISTSAGLGNGSESEIDDSDADPDYENRETIESRINSESDKSSLSGSGNEENFPLPKTRKRKANPSQWERNRVKELRNSGKEYNTLKKGTLVPVRKMGPACIETCRRKCTQKINEDERKEYFQSYWSLKDVNRQRQFIANSIEVIQPKYRYPVLREQRTARKLNHSFFLNKDQVKINVCKKFFTSTLGITNRCIRTVIEKTEKGFTEKDRRGKHEKHVTIPKEVKDGARSHISSIPTVESHYTRADSSKNYIEGGRTLMDLNRDYKQDCQKENRNFVTFSIYRQIFNYEFNYEFFKPKKDLCQFCESYKNKNHGERLDTEIEYIRHHEEKNIARSEKDEDKTRISKNYRVACFDLQAALPTPRGEVSTFYYKSKLSTYNFTICELSKKGLGTVNCYVWHEGEGHKGSNEIGSCLLHYLEMCSLRQDVAGCSKDSDEVEVVLYSDNCGGQGKNKFIIAAYLYAVSNFNIKRITHKFLVVGHTQNEGDVSHSLIEKNIKKALKSNPIYLPSQYATLISTAKKSGESFKVHELDHGFFYDLKDLVDTTATNFNSNTDGEKFNFNDICVLRVERDNPGVYFYKTSYKDDNYKTVNIRSSRTRKQLKLIKDAQLKKAYPEKIPISQRKFQDLMSLVNSNTIPRCYADFFENLKHD